MTEPMTKTRARYAALFSGVALLVGVAAVSAPERAIAQAQQSGIVGRIVVQGNERIEQDTILSYLPIQIGDTVDQAKLDLALKTLTRTELFSDVRIQLQGDTLLVQVVENPIINQVLFEGNSSLKEDKLKDEVTVRPRGIFTKAKVQEDVGRIIELYRRSGRISATVTPKIVNLPQRRVDLIFEISEGPKSGILGINFQGNQQFSANDLRDVIVTKESHWYKFFESNDNYDPDRVEYDREQLRKFYRNKGYYDFHVVSSIAELSPDKNSFAVTYTVDEGQKYKFGKLEVTTELKKLNPDILRALLPIRSGQIYADEKIEQATDALTFAAGSAGFAFVDVRPQYRANPATHTVDVTFDVKEGPRVYIDRIDIVGNTQTLDYVIRREMSLSEGDAYNRVLVDQSKNKIKSLGFFKDVDITTQPGTEPDRTNLLVKVTEQPTGELSASAGYSSVDQLVVDLGFNQSNFRGRGQDVRARVEIGSISQDIDFSFTEPRFLGRNLGAGFDLYATRYDFTQYASYSSASAGGSVHIAFPLTINSTMSLRYTLREDDTIVASNLCVPGAELVSVVLCDERGSYITSALGYSVRIDRRNDPQLPTRGYYLDLSQDVAGFGGTVHYVRTEWDGGWYHGFSKDFVLSLTTTGGFINGWDGDSIRIGDRFYRGGDSFVGFQLAGIGPRDTHFGDALGGKLYLIGEAQQTFPNGLPAQYGIKTALIADVGTLGLLDRHDKFDPLTNAPLTTVRDDLGLRASFGVSVFWKSPLGPLRFDIAEPVAKEPYDITQIFRFSTNTRF
ncbi:MAG TPA: outer membrane protein assembly factor BamA [Caulobacteraceae bacterium]|nr:outer membrane protein assembly factor BamA [Caulobacteraceae bacterium]